MTERYDTELTREGRERTLRMIDECEQVITLQRRDLAAMGLTDEEVQRAIEPLICFAAMLREDFGTDAAE